MAKGTPDDGIDPTEVPKLKTTVVDATASSNNEYKNHTGLEATQSSEHSIEGVVEEQAPNVEPRSTSNLLSLFFTPSATEKDTRKEREQARLESMRREELEAFKDERILLLYQFLEGYIFLADLGEETQTTVLKVIKQFCVANTYSIINLFRSQDREPQHVDGRTETTEAPAIPGRPLKRPQKAPALWNSADRLEKETAVAFLRRNYADYLGKGLTKADIRQLDRPLYQALASWLRKKGNELPFDLPTRQEHTDARLSTSAWEGEDLEERARLLEREASAIRRRLRKAEGQRNP